MIGVMCMVYNTIEDIFLVNVWLMYFIRLLRKITWINLDLL